MSVERIGVFAQETLREPTQFHVSPGLAEPGDRASNMGSALRVAHVFTSLPYIAELDEGPELTLLDPLANQEFRCRLEVLIAPLRDDGIRDERAPRARMLRTPASISSKLRGSRVRYASSSAVPA